MFGDYDDPDSAVSRVVRERGGYQLMPELGYNPTNHYLPVRKATPISTENMGKAGFKDRLKGIANRIVKR
jgi:Fe-S-cluster-containing dehydrogenase component